MQGTRDRHKADMETFKITVLAIQETHLTGSGIKQTKTKYGNNFDLYYAYLKTYSLWSAMHELSLLLNK